MTSFSCIKPLCLLIYCTWHWFVKVHYFVRKKPPYYCQLYCCSVSRVRINILKQLWCYNLLQSCYRQDAAKIIFSLFSRNKNRAKLRIGNPWTKLTEIWPTYDQIVIRENPFYQFWFLSPFLSYSIFFHSYAFDLLSLTSSAYYKRPNTLAKNLSPVF